MLTSTGALRAWWAIVMLLVAAVVVGGASIVYTNHVQRQSDRRWCALLSSLDQPAPEPTSARGRQIQKQIRDLRREFRCGGAR